MNFTSAGSSDPEGGPLTYAWDFDNDGTVDSTPPTRRYTYTTNGAYTAKLTVKDQTGLTAVANVPITVGNRAPTVTIDTPLDGKLASFTDKIPYKVTVTDPEDGDDRRGHRLRQHRGQDLARPRRARARPVDRDRLQGTLQTGLTAGHGAGGEHVHGHLGRLHRQGRRRRPGPLTGRAEAILQPKQKQAEFFASTGRTADGTTAGDAGRADRDDVRHRRAAARTSASSRTATTSSYKPFNLTDINEVRFRVASAGRGRHDRAALRLADRPAAWARRRRSRRPATGRPTRTCRCR